MLAAVDVQYEEDTGVAACLTFSDWSATEPENQLVTRVSGVEEYLPGEFWKRELPCIVAALQPINPLLDIVVIDGYVWLDDAGRPGLGAHLFKALGERASIVGVAKTSFAGSSHAAHVFRRGTRRPLFVTAVGMPLDEAARGIACMSGSHRIPDLLKRVDRLSRAP
jgi:deoxyribonuclease V